MKKSILVVLLASAGFAYGFAFAQTPGMKAGLWEIKVNKQIMDGKDNTTQIAAAQEKMKQMLDKMTPDQRKQMETMMGSMGTGPSGGIRICVSPAMAAKNEPMVDKDGHCAPAKVNRSGNTSTFEFNCTRDGRTTTGSGTSTYNGDSISTNVDMTMEDAKGKHTMQTATQMTYIGTDCQGVAPADQLVKNLKGQPHQ